MHHLSLRVLSALLSSFSALSPAVPVLNFSVDLECLVCLLSRFIRRVSSMLSSARTAYWMVLVLERCACIAYAATAPSANVASSAKTPISHPSLQLDTARRCVAVAVPHCALRLTCAASHTLVLCCVLLCVRRAEWPPIRRCVVRHCSGSADLSLLCLLLSYEALPQFADGPAAAVSSAPGGSASVHVTAAATATGSVNLGAALVQPTAILPHRRRRGGNGAGLDSRTATAAILGLRYRLFSASSNCLDSPSRHSTAVRCSTRAIRLLLAASTTNVRSADAAAVWPAIYASTHVRATHDAWRHWWQWLRHR